MKTQKAEQEDQIEKGTGGRKIDDRITRWLIPTDIEPFKSQYGLVNNVNWLDRERKRMARLNIPTEMIMRKDTGEFALFKSRAAK